MSAIIILLFKITFVWLLKNFIDPYINGNNLAFIFLFNLLYKSSNIGISFVSLNFPFLYRLSSLNVISFSLYVFIIASSIRDFSSSLISWIISLKKPINFSIFVARYPFWSSSKLSSLISKIFIYVFELGPNFIIVAPNALPNSEYSLSGSIIYCSNPNNAYLKIINFVKYDFPAPLVPNIHILAFLYLLESYLSININELLYIFSPIKIPSSSNTAEEING